MFDAFTDRAKKVMVLSRQAALRWQHHAIDAPHILLGIAEEGTGVAANVVREMGVSMDALRDRVARMLAPGDHAGTDASLPFTPHAKALLEAARAESNDFGHGYVGTEHLLLGAVRDASLATAVVLQELGVELGRTRQEVRIFLGMTDETATEPDGPAPRGVPAFPGSAVVLGPPDRMQLELVLPALRQAGFTAITTHDHGTRALRSLRPVLLEIERAEVVVIAAAHEPMKASFLIGLCHALQRQPLLVGDLASPTYDRPGIPVFDAGRPPFDAAVVRAFAALLQRYRGDDPPPGPNTP